MRLAMVDDGVGAQRHGGAAHGRLQHCSEHIDGVQQSAALGVDDSVLQHIEGGGCAVLAELLDGQGGCGDSGVDQDLALWCGQGTGQHLQPGFEIGFGFSGGCEGDGGPAVQQSCPAAGDHAAALHG